MSVRTLRVPVGISQTCNRFRALDLRCQSSQAVTENRYNSIDHSWPVKGENRLQESGPSLQEDLRWLGGCVYHAGGKGPEFEVQH